jgi:hypothetical protein
MENSRVISFSDRTGQGKRTRSRTVQRSVALGLIRFNKKFAVFCSLPTSTVLVPCHCAAHTNLSSSQGTTKRDVVTGVSNRNFKIAFLPTIKN